MNTQLLSPLQRKIILWSVIVGVLIIRIAACLQNPVTALDLERMIYWGSALNEHGLVAAQQPLKAFGAPVGVAWREIPVNYPVIALMFFRAIAAVAPTVVFGKFVLTGIEVINALLIARVAKSRAIGLLYWASPLSIFWVSSEGQFEPLQNLFVLVGMVLLAPAPILAGFALALAIQTKVSSVIVVCFLVFRAFRTNRPSAIRLTLGIIGGLSFSVWAQTVLPLAQQIVSFSGLSHVSNFGFNPFSTSDPTTIWRSVVSAALLGVCIIGMLKTKVVLPWLPIVVFVLFVKLSGNIQPWYLLLIPVLVLSCPTVWNKRLVGITSAVDLVALVGVITVGAAALAGTTGGSARTDLKLEDQVATISGSASPIASPISYSATPSSIAASETPSPRATAASIAITAAGVSRSLSR